MTVDSLTHLDETGKAHMVAVGRKPKTERIAVAESTVILASTALQQVMNASGKKGDALQVARIAGIMAAKRTADLIPLCHPVALTAVEVSARADVEQSQVVFSVKATAFDRTGVEMEAMTAASVAALTLYDMIKSVDRSASIQSVQLLRKSGGKSGPFVR